MLYMAPKMSPVQVMLMWQVLDENSRGYICEFNASKVLRNISVYIYALLNDCYCLHFLVL